MRKLLALATLAVLGGCAIIVAPGEGDMRVHTVFDNDKVDGNGVAARDERAVAALPALEVSGAMRVEVRVGPAPSLVVEADSNLLPLIRTETRGDTLKVYSDSQLRSRNPIRITYTVPRLSEVRASGSGQVDVRDLNGAPLDVRKSGSGEVRLAGNVDSLNARVSGSGVIDATALHSASADLDMSGSGRVSVGEVRGDYARVNVSGSGRLEAKGVVRSLNARVSGSGSAELAGLTTQEADLNASGSGGIRATVKRSLIASTGGAGGIRVYGQPAQRSIRGDKVHLID
ncbi:head GIN domain-containing protein [Massilia niastensis]|uniref:head GIN domain-containing protein n=1 Tax=Massilia niastensis TaxID=544911 RepID=UPI0003649BA9|nr:head GIN domain-containing protein [Massilia niastensis]